MSKFKKKKGGELPPVNTASLPDIVFMLLFFFMVATVLRKNDLKVLNQLPPADQIEKLDKSRTVFIYIGKPGPNYKGKAREAIVQIGDRIVDVSEVKTAILQEVTKLREELQSSAIVALKIDQDAEAGLVYDVKQELREANLPKIIFITTAGESVE
ncbi:biopolymer transporter ExbD [Dokdonia pacifica]|uniref:Biopolymer transport protein ExbD n=1 Tax=Dokdonia pacifica TaxID=1627892 RepID=A0A239AF55_9FLAO|nr:biopolymer transporter ExbD [Dokdonia pacifica]GGG38081.1 biopolymer transporter ExbD [Dokdonia pacifica]SNR93658.1 Biopolymer transport protein ExbD [Dokdonia pacifica]|mmetsp:Transcript_24209/g.31533  ORF Transcript_24209/g.31533 Transcript_24209/m.31533 type:complete len:156 (+) Transcript_24209:669-1136(+)